MGTLNNPYAEWVKSEKLVTFDGTSSGGGGKVGADVTVFTVTGVVALHYMVNVCESNLAGGATAQISMGTATVPAGLVATTTSNQIDVDEGWHDATPQKGLLEDILAGGKWQFINENVIIRPLVADTTGGSIRSYLQWKAVSPTGNVS